MARKTAPTTRRTFLEQSLLAAAAAAVPIAPASARERRRKASPNDRIQIAVIGVRGRGRGHVGEFKKSPDSQVVAVCDVDEGVIGPTMASVPDARYVKDLRDLLEDDSIDAVSIATPNHWHSLAAIWALEAGKHVYVEKPLSHNVWEGRQLVAAARRHGKIVLHGTQSRSSQATVEAMEWLRRGGLGKVELATGLCYKRRDTIGKVGAAQQPPETCDYDVWTGPAPLVPLMRQNLHYDWHWVYATGNGDIGNQGVHQMDIARWGLGVEGHPLRVASCGGRVGYDDDGDTANTQVALYDFGDKRIVFEVRGLPTDAYRGANIGVVFHGEGGYLVSASYEKVQAFDHEGQVIQEFLGGGNHFQNFLDAIKADDPSLLHVSLEEGHRSAALCHLGNVSYRLGEGHAMAAVEAPFGATEAGAEAYGRMRAHLEANGLEAKQTRLHVGPTLAFDGAKERFTGARAQEANRLLTREYREPFVVPQLT